MQPFLTTRQVFFICSSSFLDEMAVFIVPDHVPRGLSIGRGLSVRKEIIDARVSLSLSLSLSLCPSLSLYLYSLSLEQATATGLRV